MKDVLAEKLVSNDLGVNDLFCLAGIFRIPTKRLAFMMTRLVLESKEFPHFQSCTLPTLEGTSAKFSQGLKTKHLKNCLCWSSEHKQLLRSLVGPFPRQTSRALFKRTPGRYDSHCLSKPWPNHNHLISLLVFRRDYPERTTFQLGFAVTLVPRILDVGASSALPLMLHTVRHMQKI